MVLALVAAWSGDALAAFTAQSSTGPTTVTAGTVQVSINPTSAVLSYTGMLPGDSVTNGIVVTNSGSAALRYAISSSATNAATKALKDQLVLTVKSVDVTTPAAPCDNFDGSQLYTGDLDSTAGKLVGDSTQGAQTGDRTLGAGAAETLCLRATLPLATAAAYQGATTTATFAFTSEQTANN
jgi:hypothetical protein